MGTRHMISVEGWSRDTRLLFEGWSRARVSIFEVDSAVVSAARTQDKGEFMVLSRLDK